MTIDQFIQNNKVSILNIDGNLDNATITILTAENKLAFYWFNEGEYIKHIIKE